MIISNMKYHFKCFKYLKVVFKSNYVAVSPIYFNASENSLLKWLYNVLILSPVMTFKKV